VDPLKALTDQLAGCKKVADEVLSSEECKVAYIRCHNFLTELLVIADLLKGSRSEEVFRLGLKEYQFAVMAGCMGFYRQAFGALRLALELCLAAIDFSTNERRLRSWLRGESDIVWQALIDSETGVYAKSVIRVFCDDLAEQAPQYRAMTEKLYRECSEYVHGNIATHRRLPDGITFSKDIFLAWAEKASVAKLSVLFAFAARYSDDLDAGQRETIHGIVLDALGHLEPIRARFGGPAKA
jgi:hypothetical protein